MKVRPYSLDQEFMEIEVWILYFNATLHGGGHNDHPQQLWSFTAPTGRFGLVQSSYEFGHMGTNYDPDQKNV